MFKRKLFKRALPIILSVAMVFQSAPTTAFAAEGTTEPETVIEQSTEEVVDDDADDNGAGSEETGAGQNEGGNEDSQSPETQTTEETKAAETQTAEENKDAEETQTEETKAAEAETEEAVEEAADNAEAALSKAVISVDEDTLVNGLVTNPKLSGYAYDYTTKTVEKQYTPYSTEIADSVLNAVKNALSIKVNDEEKENLKWDYASYKWQQKAADSTFSDMGATELPKDAGEYKLVISLGDVEGVCTAADDVSVNLEIQKAVLTLEPRKDFDPGTTVAEVKEENADFGLLSSETDENGAQIRLDKDAYLSATSIEVKKASGGEALADTETLKKNEDYLLNINVTLKDELSKNYEVKSESYKIILADAVNTEIKVTYKNEGKTIGKTYDGKPIDAATDVASNYEAKVVYDDNGEADVPDAKLQTSWCDEEQIEYTDKDFVPVDAGTYYYKLSYTDETDTYADSEAYVRVVISMVDVIIDPVIDVKEYSEGTVASAITKNVGYDVYEVKDGVKADKPMDIDKEYFWGTSYNVNSDVEQYYAPVFAVQKGIRNGDKVTWTTLPDTAKLVNGENIVYRVVFTGKKAVFADEDDYYNDIDINTSQQNYQVDLSEAAINDYAEEITLSAPVTIDVSAILQDGAGAEYENAIVSTYDGKSIYETKEKYKKAVAKAGEKEVAKNADSSLIYTWEKANYEKDGNGNWSVTSWNTNYFENVENHSAPYQAGEYRLKVEYQDAKSGVVSSEPKYVYYTILPQDVKWVLTGTPKVYADDLTVGDFLNLIQHKDSTAVNTYADISVYTVTDKTGTKGTDISDSFDLDECYEDPDVYFYVEMQIDDGEAAGQWVKVNESDTFIAGKTYRLNIHGDDSDSFDFYNLFFNFGKDLDKHGMPVDGAKALYENETVPVEVLNSQGIELAIDIDESQITGNVKTYDAKPFDLTALKSLVKVTNAKTGEEVTDAAVKYEFLVNPETDNEGYLTGADEWWDEADAIHGGTYRLHIFVETNDKYRYSDKVLDIDFQINNAKLTVTPNLQDEIKAGIECGEWIDEAICDGYQVTGYVGDDADLIHGAYACVYTANSKEEYTGYLRSGKTYYVTCTNGSFKTADEEGNPLYGSGDYELVYERASFVPVRAEASVETTSYNDDSKYVTKLKDTVTGTPADGYTHTVTTLEGIPYLKNIAVTVNGKDKTLEGNLFIFDIVAPKEFSGSDRGFDNDTFVYEKSIENAGGYILFTSSDEITVVFEADPEKLTEKKEFEILWDTGYAEQFAVDFSSSILEDDLTRAVAPKSLAFNGVNTKMAVGDTQQLDVKITKAQMSDIILLGYKSYDEEVVKVTDNGFVTALSTKGAKSATATVEVYPCYMNEEGVKTRIANAKSATVKITVSDVAAPKISSVVLWDTDAIVKYTKPANGYRREIYVLEGKKKEADFENIIKDVKNGDYSAFVFTNLTAYEDYDNANDAKKGIVYTYVDNLLPQTEYTVYVRNVSGLRALDDGSKVASSHAGAAKTFKTTKAMNVALEAYFDKDLQGQTAFWNDDDDCYYAKLADKSAQLSVDAAFWQKHSQSYSDEYDYIWRTLPLSADGKKSYEEPKLSYFASTGYCEDDKVDGWYYSDGDWYEPSDLASVDKKGKVTFQGKGYVKIFVKDTVTGNDADVDLYIDASADSITGKAVKMSVGQTIYLNDYLEYKEGKNKLVDYQYGYARLSIDKESDEYFSIEPYMNGDGTACDYEITALKPGGKLDLTVTDKTVEANGGKSATVKITSSVVEPVKNLKASYVADKKFAVTFSYPQPYYDFQFDLKDERGKTIRTETETLGDNTYNSKTKSYDYEVGFTYPEITLLSTYNLTVTALYNGQPSKEAKLKVKTTNIPASYFNLGKGATGGTEVLVTTKKSNNGNIYLSNYPVLKSGNTYTLDVPLNNSQYDNRAAKYRKTDTLTWKSTNTKVATVKANAGSYNATLKALSKGETTIEITSKITKKVIARYVVTVNAVGEAGGYFGDNEPYRSDLNDGIDSVVVDEKDVLELTMNNRIVYSLNKGEGQWYVFTAPAYGDYEICADHNMSIYVPDDGAYVLKDISACHPETLSKGEKRYIYIENKTTYKSISGYVWVEGTMYTELTLGENKVKGGSDIVFIAPTENCYTIAYDNNGQSVVLDTPRLGEGDTWEYTMPGIAGKDYIVTVSCREADKAAVGGDGAAVSLGSATDEKWFSFTADETGYYTFYTTGATDQVVGGVYNSLSEAPAMTTAENVAKDYVSDEQYLEKGWTVYIRLSAPNATKDKAVTATFKVDKAPSIGVDGKGSVSTDGTTEKIITYVIPSQGDYRFTFSATPADAVITAKVWDNPVTNNVYENCFRKNDFIEIRVSTDKAATVNVVAEKTNIHALAVGDNTIKVAANASEKAAFYATNSGLYTFKFAPADGVTVYDGFYEGSEISAKTMTVSLVPGDSVPFRIEAAAEKDVTVTVTKETINNLVTGNVDLVAGETKYYKYTAEKEGWHKLNIPATEGVTVQTGWSLWFDDEEPPFADGNQHLGVGTTFYVKFTAETDATVPVTIGATEALELTAGAESPLSVELPANGTTYVKFTSKKTTRYEFTKTDAEGFDVQLHCSLDPNDEGDENLLNNLSSSRGDIISASESIYFKVTNNNTETKTIKLAINEVTAAAAGTSVSLKNGEGKWFKFTADATARYKFDVTAVKDGKEPNASIEETQCSLDEYCDDAAWPDGFGNCIVKSGETLYLYVVANCEGEDYEAAVKLNVTKAGADGDLTATDGYAFTAGAQKSLIWTAPSDGWFELSAKKGDADAGDLEINYYRNLDEGYSYFDPGWVMQFEKGDQLTFEIKSDIEQTVKFAMSDVTVTPVTGEPATISVESGEVRYFSFEEKDEARYFIELTDVDDGLSFDSRDMTDAHEGTVGSIADGYYSFVGSINSTYVFTVEAQGEFEGNKSFKIKGGAVAPIALAAGTPATIAKDSVLPNHYTWYKFTAPEDGRYAFKLANASAKKTSASLTSNITAATFPTEDIFEKNQTVYFAVYNTGVPANDVTISVTKPVATELTESSPLTIDISKVEAGENVWASFTVPADGYYTFAAANGTVNANAYKDIAKTDEDDNHTSGSLPFESFLEAGDQVLYALTYSGAPTQNITVSVKKAEPVALTAGEEKELTLEAGEYKYLTFTADKDEVCEIKTTETSNVVFSLMDGDKYLVSEEESLKEVIVPNGKTVTFKAGNTGSDAVTAKVLLSTEQAVTLTEGENKLNFGEAETVKYAVFTVAESGLYKFELNGSYSDYRLYSDTNVRLYTSSNYTENYYFAKGETITAKFNASAGSETTFTITRDSSVIIDTITLGQELYIEAGYKVAEFTAPETAEYTFYSVNNNLSDPDAYLYVNQIQVAHPINKGNFKITYRLKKGQTAFLKSYNYTWDESDTYRLPYTIGVK